MEEAQIKVKKIRNWYAKTLKKRDERKAVTKAKRDAARKPKRVKKEKGVLGWVKREVKRIEKLKERAFSGKRKRKIASAKYIKDVLSAAQHVSKTDKSKVWKIEDLTTV